MASNMAVAVAIYARFQGCTCILCGCGESGNASPFVQDNSEYPEGLPDAIMALPLCRACLRKHTEGEPCCVCRALRHRALRHRPPIRLRGVLRTPVSNQARKRERCSPSPYVYTVFCVPRGHDHNLISSAPMSPCARGQRLIRIPPLQTSPEDARAATAQSAPQRRVQTMPGVPGARIGRPVDSPVSIDPMIHPYRSTR